MKCKNCGEVKEIYAKNICRRCYDKQYWKQWQEKNKEYDRKRQYIWRENNKEKIRADTKHWREQNPDYGKQWRENNKEKVKANIKRWQENNKEKISQQDKIYYQNNKDKRKEYNRKNRIRINRRQSKYQLYRECNDIKFKLRMIYSTRVKNAIKNKAGKKAYKTVELLGCSIQQCIEYLEKQFKEGMSWENYGKWHIDHKKPCNNFDLTNPEQQKLCFHYTNLQPLWAKENLSKGCKIMEEEIKNDIIRKNRS